MTFATPSDIQVGTMKAPSTRHRFNGLAFRSHEIVDALFPGTTSQSWVVTGGSNIPPPLSSTPPPPSVASTSSPSPFFLRAE
jgi:hypothetical protein